MLVYILFKRMKELRTTQKFFFDKMVIDLNFITKRKKNTSILMTISGGLVKLADTPRKRNNSTNKCNYQFLKRKMSLCEPNFHAI